MRFIRRLCLFRLRRRRGYHARHFVAVLLAAVLAPLASLHAQTLALPASAPDSLMEGASVIVRPIVRDVIGRPASVSRVQAWSEDTAVVRVAYVTGGQRLTAGHAGVAVIQWRWQRTDGINVALADTIRVTPQELPPPVVTPPVVTPPVAVDTSVVALTLSPSAAIVLAQGQRAPITVAGATLAIGTVRRPATAAELAALPVVWRVTGGAVTLAVTDPRHVQAQLVAVGTALVSACVSETCAVLGVSVRAPMPVDTTTPVVVAPPDTTPVVILPPPADSTPTAPLPDDTAAVHLARDTVHVGDTVTVTLGADVPASGWEWSLGKPWPALLDAVPRIAADSAYLAGLAIPHAGIIALGDLVPDPHALNVWPWPVASFTWATPADGVAFQTARTVRVIAWRPGAQPLGVIVGEDRTPRRVTLIVVP